MITGVCTGARAQTASQITPPSFAPPTQEAGSPLIIPEDNGLVVPEGAANLTVTLNKVVVEGGMATMANETDEITAPLSGHRVTATEIFTAARALEQAYARDGFVLARVVLPPQKIENGQDLHLLVIDGFIERVDVSSLSPQVQDHIAAMLQSLIGKHGLTIAAIERQLLLAGDTPGVALRSTLAPGTEKGGSVLVIEAQYAAIDTLFGFDNTQAEDLGRYRTSLGFNFNSLAGIGDLLYLRANGDATDGIQNLFSHQPRNRILAGGVVVPVGADGVTVNFEATDARATPLAPAGSFLAETSDFNRYSLRVRYPWLRSYPLTINSEASFDAEEERDSIVAPAATISLDQLRVFRGGGDIAWSAPWQGSVTGRMVASFGVNALGARSAADASASMPLSRQGADAQFQKLELTLDNRQPVLDHLALDTQFHGQTSFNQVLVRSEQIGLESQDGLSIFGNGTLQGDAGYVFRSEVQAPFDASFTHFGDVMVPYLFGAYGLAKLEDPTALEPVLNTSGSYGIGVRLGSQVKETRQVANLSLEWGRLMRSDLPSVENRITFGASFAF